VRCPQGHLSVAWWEHGGGQGSRPIIVEFDKHTCGACPVRTSCTRAKHTGWRLKTSTRRCKRRRRGLPVKRASSSINGGLASKGRCRRGSAPLAYAGPDIGGRIGKKGATYAACFRDLRNDWGVSTFLGLCRPMHCCLTHPGAKLGVWHVPVTTPIMTSSHRPALQAARRCLRPLTVLAGQNDPGALKRRLITRRTVLST
jgi:Transposase DDE domain